VKGRRKGSGVLWLICQEISTPRAYTALPLFCFRTFENSDAARCIPFFIFLLWFSFFFFIYKVFVLVIIMQLDISAKLTPQVTTIICHHMKKILLKKRKKKENTKIWKTRPKVIC